MTYDTDPKGSNHTPAEHAVHLHDIVVVGRSSSGQYQPLDVQLCYDTRNPFEIKASFSAIASGKQEWLFSRELLLHGLLVSAGEGDVQIRPCAEGLTAWIDLKSSDDSGSYLANAKDLSGFLDCAYNIIAPGEETSWIDYDLALHRLLSGA
ncbi:SsgA family sporulation/cell division regulator [Amycolatopsis sp. cg5]|uniref:SsgA family sporulation/cell division regulator n=1 Tax=Amycolatopsis sp. cg5 TaxID=3238802 RepID=UPI0035253014